MDTAYKNADNNLQSQINTLSTNSIIKSIQRGSFEIPTTGSNRTVALATSVNINKTIILINNSVNSTNCDYHVYRYTFTNSNTII